MASIQAILDRPDVRDAIKHPRRIDRTHDVPYLAGSNAKGGVTYIDRRVPQTLKVEGQRGGIVHIDPAEALNVHEQVEHALMVHGGMPYETAHRIALKHEQKAVEKRGAKWSAYQAQMHKLAAKTQAERPTEPPADLYTKPYPHTEAEFLKREAIMHKSTGGAVAYNLRRGGSVRVLGQGNIGDTVTDVQKKLANLGYDVNVDGKYGAQTRAAVLQFQKDHGLKLIDGLVGPETSGALTAATMPMPRLRPADQATKEEPAAQTGIAPFSSKGSLARAAAMGDVPPTSTVYGRMLSMGVKPDTAARSQSWWDQQTADQNRRTAYMFMPEPSPGAQRKAAEMGAAPTREQLLAADPLTTGNSVVPFGLKPPSGIAASLDWNETAPSRPRPIGSDLPQGIDVSTMEHNNDVSLGRALAAKAAQRPAMSQAQFDARFDPVSSGLLNSPVAGRTDRLPIAVPRDSYVVPADVVSGLGQGNTQAGARILDQISSLHAGMKRGGTPHGGKQVPIVAAGGEYIVHPAAVASMGGGDMNKGHKVLDRMVMNVRRQTANRLKTLPGPKK